MSRDTIIRLFADEEPAGITTAMTWVPVGAARALTWGFGIENEPEALAGLARALGVDLAFVPASKSWAAEAVRVLQAEDIAAGWIVDGMFGRVAELKGWTRTLAASAGAPEVLDDDLDLALEDALADARAGDEAAADVLLIADDLASTAGWLVSPDFAIETLVPRYGRLAEAWPQARRAAAFHSDGDIRVMYGALAAAGFSATHIASGQRASMSATFAAARAAGLMPIGGVEAQRLLVDGAHLAGKAAATLAAEGVAIVSDDGGFTSAEEVAAFGTALAAFRATLGDGSKGGTGEPTDV